MQVGQLLRTLRTSAGLTQGELSSRAGISPSFLSLLEANKRDPTVSVLRRLGRELGMPPSVLIAAALVDEVEPSSPEEQRVREIMNSLVRAANHLLLARRLDREAVGAE